MYRLTWLAALIVCLKDKHSPWCCCCPGNSSILTQGMVFSVDFTVHSTLWSNCLETNWTFTLVLSFFLWFSQFFLSPTQELSTFPTCVACCFKPTESAAEFNNEKLGEKFFPSRRKIGKWEKKTRVLGLVLLFTIEKYFIASFTHREERKGNLESN